MAVSDKEHFKAARRSSQERTRGKWRCGRLARKLFAGQYQPGESVELSKVAADYHLDVETVVELFLEFQTLGMVTLSGKNTAIVCSPNPKEMYEAYEIRAALEEIAGRTAAPLLKGKTQHLRSELDAMRIAVELRNLDSYAEHDVRFHRCILQASQNDVLLQVWDTLAFDLRIRAAVGKATRNLPEVVESHRPIVDALDRGQGREAGLLLRNHVETFLQFLRKADSDSGIHRAVFRDLESAKDVQKALFPQKNICIPRLCSQTFYKPAQGIGGDYYDLFPLQDDRWAIAIGDVAGKGIGAALIMASLQASLRAQALHAHSDLATLMANVDRLVHASSPVHLYASLFYAEFQPATRTLEYVNAGHNPPMVIRWEENGCRVFPLKAGGTPIGLLEGAQFETGSFPLEPDDVLVAYTDGITESDNLAGELWGQDGLEKLLRGCRGKSSEEIVRSILDERFAFADGMPQRDDMTLLVMRVTS